MKKFLCLILALMLPVCAVGCTSTDKNKQDNISKEDAVTVTKNVLDKKFNRENKKEDAELIENGLEETIAKEDSKADNKKDTDEKNNTESEEKVIDEKVLDELEGIYLPLNYVNKISETRSLSQAYPLRLGLWIIKDEDGSYRVGGGDLHQGGLELGIISSTRYKDGVYTITSESVNGSAYMVMKYSPGSEMVAVEKFGDAPFWYEGEDLIVFYKYTNGRSEQKEIAQMIFGQRDLVSYKSDGAYINIDNKEYKVKFELSGVVTEPLETGLSSYDGYLLLYSLDDDCGYYGEYLLKGDKIQIVSPDLGINIEI